MSCGTPQGSIPGPIFFSLYMLPLVKILFKIVAYHCYADDIHLYVSFESGEFKNLDILHNCQNAIKVWMSGLTGLTETEIFVSSLDHAVEDMSSDLKHLAGNIKTSAKNLGVLFD